VATVSLYTIEEKGELRGKREERKVGKMREEVK